jgi:transaldolase
MTENNPLRKLQALGQSIWLDDIHRGMLRNGEFASYVSDDGVAGVTSNPAILKKAILGHSDYDASIAELARAGKDARSVYEALVIADLREAADMLREHYDRTGGHDGYVSMEVNPHIAHDTEQTITAARRLWTMLDRPNVMIKVPATLAGLPAIRALIAEGINVNATLLFSVERYREVARAYIEGLQERADRGLPVSGIASVASFFLSRIDVLVDELLNAKEDAHDLQGKAAIAAASHAYRVFRELVASDAWKQLAKNNAMPQRLLWASTSTKNPAYSDVMYVEPLIAEQTVNTLPLKTLDAYRDHGKPEPRIRESIAGSGAILGRLEATGIDMEAVAGQLEAEGIEKFIQPFDELLETLEEKISQAIAGKVPD